MPYTRSIRTWVASLVLLLLSSLDTTSWAGIEYQLMDLGMVRLTDVDEHGNGVGAVITGATFQAAVFESGQPPQLLGFLPGGTISQANAAFEGRIVGESRTGDHGLVTHAFVVENGIMRDLGTLGGDPTLEASATNLNATQALGSCGPPASAVACVWDLVAGTGPEALPTLGGPWAHGLALNAVGVGVGDSTTADFATHATLWGLGAPIDLTPGLDTGSRAYDINDANVVVGQAGSEAFRWSIGDGLETFGTLPGDVFSRLVAINTAGVAVGTSFSDSPPPGPPRPSRAIRVMGDTMEDLNTLVKAPGWVFQFAMGISPQGIIGGNGTYNGQPRAWLLIPKHQDKDKAHK